VGKKIYKWENTSRWGSEMSQIVRVDEKGRIIIPKSIREKVELKEKDYVSVRVEKKKIILEPLKSVANKYFGIFKIERWPEDLDEFSVEVIRRWWKTKAT